MADQRVKHGMGRRIGRPPEFGVWLGMRRRCSDEGFKSYPDYGGRGHPFTPENTLIREGGKRGCKTCRALNMKSYYERKRVNV